MTSSSEMPPIPYYQQKQGLLSKVATKLGVIFNPPSLVLIYEARTGTSAKKRRKRIISLQHIFEYDLSVKFMMLDIQDYLEDIEGLSASHIEKMLRIIQEHNKGLSLKDALTVVSKEFPIQSDEDFNKLSTPELQRKKAIMQQSYLQNCIKPGDPCYVYDKQVEFDNVKKEPAEWDTEGNDEYVAEECII